MSKNYMEQVARMLGVEMGEKFCIDGGDVKYKFDDDGIYYLSHRQEVWSIASYNTVMGLLTGKCKIRKILQQEHTGLEDVDAGQNVYILFGARDGITGPHKTVNGTEWFTDKYIRDNWERYIVIKKRLAKVASELNTEPIDWNNRSQDKWRIHYDEDLDFCHSYDVSSDSIYFTSEEAAKKAIEIVGKDDLIWMLRDFQPFIGYLAEVAE